MALVSAVATVQNGPAIAPPERAESAKYGIEVEVVDQDGAVIPDAEVTLTGSRDQKWRRGTSIRVDR
ncbi:MAG: hypothetical protein WB566_04890 [Terriglobales bacterium]